MNKVCILLATYNGHKYLKEQLDSLLNQTYDDFLICIRDDCSSDDTLSIISEYVNKYEDRFVVLNTEKNLGFPDCFWRLLKEAPKADFYSFCDQDDVWYPTKLERAVKRMASDEIINPGKPKLYYHSYDICDADGNIIDSYMPGNILDRDILKHFFYAYTLGFSMIINGTMRELLLSYEPEGKVIAHDVWSILNAYYFGDIYYDEEPQASYRRHEDTVTSAGKGYVPLIKSWWKKEICGNEMEILRGRLAFFYDRNRGAILKSDREKFETFINNRGVLSYLKKLFYPRRLKDSFGGELATRILFLLNK